MLDEDLSIGECSLKMTAVAVIHGWNRRLIAVSLALAMLKRIVRRRRRLSPTRED